MRAEIRFIVAGLALVLVGCNGAADPYLLGAEDVPTSGDSLTGSETSPAEDSLPEDDWLPEDDVAPVPDLSAADIAGEDIDPMPLPALASCGAAPVWTTATDTYEIIYGSPLLTVAPGDALAARAGGGPLAFYRMSDGLALGTHWGGGWDEYLDGGWAQRMVVVQQGDEAAWVEIQDARTGEVLHLEDALPSPDPDLHWLRVMRAFLNPDGTRLATLTCWSKIPSDSSVARVQVHDLETGDQGPIIDLDVDCGDNLWPRAAPAVLSHDGRRLVLTFMAQPEVYVVDLEAGTAASFDPVGELPDAIPVNENWGYGNTTILGIALHPDGDAMALTDRAGRLTRWSLPGLTSLGEPWGAGLVGINQFTYGPSMESPVNWSEDGALLAHLDEDGEAVIRRADDGEVLLTLPRPDLIPPDWTSDEIFNPATAFRFTADGAGVLVSFEMGLGLWRCPDMGPGPEPGLLGSVTIEGPVTVDPTGNHTWTAAAVTGGQPVVFRLLLDGEPAGAGLGGLLTATLYEPGTHTIQAIADDGVTQETSPILEVIVQ
jgi:hypothetical protein